MTTQQKRAKVSKIERKLNELAELKAEVAQLQEKQQKVIDQLLEADPKAQAKYIRFQTKIEGYTEMIEDETADVKDAVLALGETVKAEDLQAVWSKGKTSWNTNQLLGFAKAHREILEMKTDGDPSISIRKVKK